MSSRAQFAQRVLRPCSSQPLRANLPLYLWRTCCIRRIHRYLGRSRPGFHRMDSGMARTIAGGLGQQAVILNRGVSGEVAEGTAERIRSEVDDTVRSTIRWLKENRIDVVLVGVQYTVCLARDANYVA